ncbi:MAG: hypothetical protein J7J17_04375 [Hadesarchaea archaeon]|nr:hypothetical protein [Hadesarchaea archaeon]
MSVPSEIAWLVPLVVPFIVGLLIGAIIKRTAKLLLVIVALIVVLIGAGAVSWSYSDLYDKSLEVLPKLWSEAQGFIGTLPYSTPSFLVGLGLGLWKG